VDPSHQVSGRQSLLEDIPIPEIFNELREPSYLKFDQDPQNLARVGTRTQECEIPFGRVSVFNKIWISRYLALC
jgi:hypothetical protein